MPNALRHWRALYEDKPVHLFLLKCWWGHVKCFFQDLLSPSQCQTPGRKIPAKRHQPVHKSELLTIHSDGEREAWICSKAFDLWLVIICFGAPQPRVLCGVTCKNKSINPNQSPIIHSLLQFSQQKESPRTLSLVRTNPIVFHNQGALEEKQLLSCSNSIIILCRFLSLPPISSFNEKMENCFPFELQG